MKLATLCYVIDVKKNKTLMIHRVKKENDYHDGKWNGLGGKLEQGESPEDCVIREIKEETGLIIKNPKMHGIITFPLFDKIDDWYVFIFSAREFKGNLIDSPEGNLAWVPNNELTSLNLWDGDKIFLKWVFPDKSSELQSRFFSAKFNYEAGKFLNHEVSFY